MKIKFFSVLIALSSVLVSCKNDAKTADGEEKKIEKNYFSVEVEAATTKSDNFAMYYSEDGTSVFKDINAVWHGIEGGKPQAIEFKLKEELIPTHIRLDFGMEKSQDSVVIKNIKVNYYDNVFEFKGSDFFKYFIENNQFVTKVDPAAGTMTIFKNGAEYKTPYYYPTQITIDNIKKITGEQTAAK